LHQYRQALNSYLNRVKEQKQISNRITERLISGDPEEQCRYQKEHTLNHFPHTALPPRLQYTKDNNDKHTFATEVARIRNSSLSGA
jgi:hypothetical protein